jgi:amino acid transporter
MKTLGRILIILVAFALVMGITYAVVNAGGFSLGGGSRFENGEHPQFANSERPFPPNGQFQPGQRPEGFEGRERGGGSLVGMMFGFVKNTVIIAVAVALIAVPRNWLRNRKRTVSMAAE